MEVTREAFGGARQGLATAIASQIQDDQCSVAPTFIISTSKSTSP